MISILIATKGRPAKLKNLLDSIDIECEVIIAADQQSDLPDNIKDAVVIFSQGTVVEKFELMSRVAKYDIMGIADDCVFVKGTLHIVNHVIDRGKLNGFNTRNLPTATPILVWGRKYFDRVGYLFHPDYQHFYSDTDAIDEAIINESFVKYDIAICDHFHPCITKVEDETHRYRRAERLIHDERVYNERSLRRAAVYGSRVLHG